MTRRMLINANHQEECRIAIADDSQLLELEVESAASQQLKGNVYKASITRIEPSLQAAFLDIGSKRNGFLQINDIHPAYFRNWPPEEVKGRPARPSIQDVLSAGQNLIVQVVKDEREAKGATLTTNLSIPGRFLVLMIGSQRGGVSRKISDAGQRSRLRQAVQNLKVPPGMSVIVRTAGIDKSGSELQGDLDNLLNNWREVVTKSLDNPPTPCPLLTESNLAIRTVRDFLTSDIDEILVDEKEVFSNVEDFVQKNVPSFKDKIKFYQEDRPLFSNFMLDNQIEAIDSPEVTLPSGGSIVIDTTEAVVAVDVNSGRSTGQADVEETAFATNKEAAKTIATQLRLRDLGGLVVIDFIDMLDKRHRLVVEKTLKEALKKDKAKVEMSRISKFGLLEMSRQRLKTSLASQRYSVCPYCDGRGRVKTSKSAALEAFRKIESTAFAGGIEKISVRMNPSAAFFLLNEKRSEIVSIEQQAKVKIMVFPHSGLRQHEYELELDSGSSESKSASSSMGRTRRGDRQRSSGRRRSSRKGNRRNNPEEKRQKPKGAGRRGNRRGSNVRSKDDQNKSDARADDQKKNSKDSPKPDSKSDTGKGTAPESPPPSE